MANSNTYLPNLWAEIIDVILVFCETRFQCKVLACVSIGKEESSFVLNGQRNVNPIIFSGNTFYTEYYLVFSKFFLCMLKISNYGNFYF